MQLIQQNHQVDRAMGILQSSLSLSNIGSTKEIDGIPPMVKETFVEVRRALLEASVGTPERDNRYAGLDAEQSLQELAKQLAALKGSP